MEKRKGRLAFRSAAVLFVLAAVSEIFSFSEKVPLFGAVRGDGAAVAYHLTYILLYAALAVGLWRARPWGYALILAGTAVATLDSAQILLNLSVVTDEIAGLLAQYGAGGMVDSGLLARAAAAMAISVAVGWWGFALYAYFRRGYFGIRTEANPPA